MPIAVTEQNSSDTPRAIVPRLGLWDAVSIIIGVVVGTAIFRSPSAVFANSPGSAVAMAQWLLGGLLSWCGAVCYAELATTYPRDGGDYVYLTRAFGPWCGFLFGWAQLTTILSGNIAIMAYAFADYGLKLWPQLRDYAVWLTIAPVIALSMVNAGGVVMGKVTQNVLTAVKVIGLGGLVLAALVAGKAEPQASTATGGEAAPDIGLALVFVLYAYGGWSHAAYVAAEVRDQRRNLPRALVLGLACITLVYLAVNAAYLAVLGFGGASRTQTPAAEVIDHAFGLWGGRALSLLVMLSALGAINGMILTGTRIYAVWGADYPMLRWLGVWNRTAAVPTAAIAVQAAIAAGLILLVGTAGGHAVFDAALRSVGIRELSWAYYAGGFETLVAGSAPVYWTLSLATGVAILVLRARDRSVERPFTMPVYPLPALVFCGTCLYMLQASLAHAKWLSLIGFIPLGVGGVVWALIRVRS